MTRIIISFIKKWQTYQPGSFPIKYPFCKNHIGILSNQVPVLSGPHWNPFQSSTRFVRATLEPFPIKYPICWRPIGTLPTTYPCSLPSIWNPSNDAPVLFGPDRNPSNDAPVLFELDQNPSNDVPVLFGLDQIPSNRTPVLLEPLGKNDNVVPDHLTRHWNSFQQDTRFVETTLERVPIRSKQIGYLIGRVPMRVKQNGYVIGTVSNQGQTNRVCRWKGSNEG